jgi:hypothetical protein
MRYHSIPAAELADGEPSTGGLFFVYAVWEWGELPEYWMKCGGDVPADDEPLCTHIVQRIQRDATSKNFLRRWYQNEFVAFGFPLHDLTATRRVVLPPKMLHGRLLFDKWGNASDSVVLQPKLNGLIAIKKRNDGIGTRKYRHVLFYPAEQEALTPPEAIATGYGEKSIAVNAFISNNSANLAKLPNRDARARYVRQSLSGCGVSVSLSLIRKALKREDL